MRTARMITGAGHPAGQSAAPESPAASRGTARLLRLGGSSRRRSQHCVLFGVDVVDFTDQGRDDQAQLAVRDTLYRLLPDAFDVSGMSWEDCLHQDRGDGILVVIPARMPSITVVEPLLSLVHAALRRHNRTVGAAAAIRLRAAVHIGEVHQDDHGLAGSAVNHLCQLLDAPDFKGVLSRAEGDLALVASAYFHDSVLRHCPDIASAMAFTPLTITTKRTRTPASVVVLHGAGIS